MKMEESRGNLRFGVRRPVDDDRLEEIARPMHRGAMSWEQRFSARAGTPACFQDAGRRLEQLRIPRIVKLLQRLVLSHFLHANRCPLRSKMLYKRARDVRSQHAIATAPFCVCGDTRLFLPAFPKG
jgi:hypothetical protein